MLPLASCVGKRWDAEIHAVGGLPMIDRQSYVCVCVCVVLWRPRGVHIDQSWLQSPSHQVGLTSVYHSGRPDDVVVSSSASRQSSRTVWWWLPAQVLADRTSLQWSWAMGTCTWYWTLEFRLRDFLLERESMMANRTMSELIGTVIHCGSRSTMNNFRYLPYALYVIFFLAQTCVLYHLFLGRHWTHSVHHLCGPLQPVISQRGVFVCLSRSCAVLKQQLNRYKFCFRIVFWGPKEHGLGRNPIPLWVWGGRAGKILPAMLWEGRWGDLRQCSHH